MIHKNFLFKTIRSIHISEKSNQCKEKNNVMIFKVHKNSTKREIKISVSKMFQIKVKKVNLLNVKGKIKKKGKNLTKPKSWKKAYIFFQENQNLDFLTNS
ncbi:50S ribosomal protein L23 [Buchnera aphidicola (Periphyllus testudinaceus)]|uniref:50S ribosomal protein L23 n=1 Tax=Buchnera aphidicola TaxID=9 RepID=UPI003463C670